MNTLKNEQKKIYKIFFWIAHLRTKITTEGFTGGRMLRASLLPLPRRGRDRLFVWSGHTVHEMGTRETLGPKLSGMLTSCTQCQGKHSNTFGHAISERWRDKQNGKVIWGTGNNIRHALPRNGQRNKKNKNNNYNDKKKRKTETIPASLYCPNYLKNNIEPHGNLIDSYTCYRLRVCSTRYFLTYWKQDITESKILHPAHWTWVH